MKFVIEIQAGLFHTLAGKAIEANDGYYPVVPTREYQGAFVVNFKDGVLEYTTSAGNGIKVYQPPTQLEGGRYVDITRIEYNGTRHGLLHSPVLGELAKYVKQFDYNILAYDTQRPDWSLFETELINLLKTSNDRDKS